MDAAVVVAVVLDGVVAGLQIGLLALGLSLLHGLGGVLNLAHGALAVVAAVVAANALGAGWPAPAAAVAGIAAAAAGGLLLDRTLLQPVYRSDPRHRVLRSLLVTLGTAVAVDGVAGWRYPGGALSLRVGGGAVDLLGVPMRRGSLWAAAASAVVLLALVAVLRWTTPGRAVRAAVQDEEGARLLGIDPDRVRTAVAVGAGALAGLVAVTLSMTSPVTVTSGFELTTLALIATVVGGLGSASGALVAGLLLGVVDAVGAAAVGASTTAVVLLAVAGTAVVVRPGGLLARTR
jgi:branched-chain amino acid transport system permease protein